MKEKRKPRAYKITDTDYNKAMDKAQKRKVKFASVLEQFAIAYGKGYHIGYVNNNGHNVEFL